MKTKRPEAKQPATGQPRMKHATPEDIRATIHDLDSAIAELMVKVQELRRARNRLVELFGVDVTMSESWEL